MLCTLENTSHTELYGVGSMHWIIMTFCAR